MLIHSPNIIPNNPALCYNFTMQNEDIDTSRAAGVFHQPPFHANCAQSVAILAGREDLVGELAACGGGRAPGGLCGALHTALLLSPAEKRDEIIAEFRDGAGATTCREIKGTAKTPCEVCVALGDLLRAKFSQQGGTQ